MADPDRFLLQPDVALDWIESGQVRFVRKRADGTWPDRPTDDPNVLVFWIGTDPSPAGVTAPAVNGMYPGDVRIVG